MEFGHRVEVFLYYQAGAARSFVPIALIESCLHIESGRCEVLSKN